MLSQVFCCCSGEECSSALKHCFQDQLYMTFMYSELLQIFSAYCLMFWVYIINVKRHSKEQMYYA